MTRVANDRLLPGGLVPTSTAHTPTRRPGLALRQVLELAVLDGSVVLAGGAGLDRPISRLNVMEVPDVLPWVRPGELLVTTGYALRDEPERLADLIRELDGRGVAALGIKLGRYLEQLPPGALAVADELDFPIVRSREPDRRHCRLCACRHEAQLLDQRGSIALQSVAHELSQLGLALGGRTEAEAESGGALHRRDHLRMRVPKNCRAPCADQVDVFCALDIRHVRTGSRGEESRSPADRAEGPHW